MKKLLIVLFVFGSFSTFAETITIVKPLIEVEGKTIGSTIYSGTANTTGSFNMTFTTKVECIKWVEDSVKVLKTHNKAVFSANCSNDDSFSGGVNKDGSYSGFVSYL